MTDTAAPATQTNGAAAPQTNGAAAPAAPDMTPSKPATLHERLVAAAKATKAAADEGKGVDDAVAEGVAKADAEVEPAADDAKAPAAKEPKKEPEENPIARIQREMRAREKARSIELEATKLREAAAAEAAALKEQQAAFQRDRQQLSSMLEQFRADPVKFAEQNGISRDKLAEDWANQGKPEHQIAQRLEAQEQTIQKLIAHIQQSEQQRQQQETAAQQQQREAAERAAERRFISDYAAPEKAPNLHKVAQKVAELTRQGNDGAVRFIVDRANAVADWFKAETGKYPSWDVLADYLEQEATSDLAKDGGAQSKAPKPAGKSTATTRTLSQEMSGERRSAVKPLQELSKSERLAAMEQAARDARRSAG